MKRVEFSETKELISETEILEIIQSYK